MPEFLNHIGNDEQKLLEISQCETTEEFIRLMKNIKSTNKRWHDFISPLFKEKGIKAAMIEIGCNVSNSTAKRCINAIPAKRDIVIGIAILLGFNLEETNKLLALAQYERLYSRSVDDAIWIFLIESNCNLPEEERCKTPIATKMEMNKMAESIRRIIGKSNDNNKMGTVTWFVQIQNTRNLIEFEELIRNHIGEFSVQNERLVNLIETAIQKTPEKNAHFLFSDNETFQDYHYHQMQKLRNKEHPNRMHLILLGLYLRYTNDEINELLDVAGFSPLCPNDNLEAAIYFNLEQLNILNPFAFPKNYMNANLQDYLGKETDNLSEEIVAFLEEDKHCFDLVVEKLEILKQYLPINLKKMHQK